MRGSSYTPETIEVGCCNGGGGERLMATAVGEGAAVEKYRGGNKRWRIRASLRLVDRKEVNVVQPEAGAWGMRCTGLTTRLASAFLSR